MSPRETYGTFSTAYVEAMRLRLSALETEAVRLRLSALETEAMRLHLSELETENKGLAARVAELEEALENVINAGKPNQREHPSMWKAWLKARVVMEAKEATPCQHCLRVECECSDFDVCPDMGAK